MSGWKRYFPWVVLAVAALYLVGIMAPAGGPADGMDLSAFAALPVIDGGRLKPIDTFARVRLMVISRRQTYVDEHDQRQPAVRWLLNILAEGLGDFDNVLLVPDKEVQEWFGLPPRPAGRFAVREVLDGARARADQLRKLMRKPEKELAPEERKVLAVATAAVDRSQARRKMRQAQGKQGSPQKVEVFRIDFDQLLAMLKLEPREGFRYSLEELTGPEKQKYFAQFLKKAQQAAERPEKRRDLVDVRALELHGHLRTHYDLARLGGVLMVPGRGGDLEDWKTLRDALIEGDAGGNPAAESVENILRAYALGDARAFNREVHAYRQAVQKRLPGEMKLARTEVWFNHFAPFYQCANLYVLMFLLAVLSWVVWPDVLGRAAFWLGLLLALVHTLALLLRMYIQGRPPVTNLYSSAVFIGWGCVLLCLFVEHLYRNGVGTAVAAMLGFATMIIAHHLGGSGDTMEMMQAVLDTNFWLATHVTTVTLGYTATFVAGFLATVFIFRMLASTARHFSRARSPLSGGEQAAFAAACLGVVGIPAVVVVGLIYGLWALWTSGETMSFGVALALAAPAVVPAALAVYWLITRRSSPAGVPAGVEDALGRLALTADSSRGLAGMIYGTVCFATLLSFVGTVLGGIWADQSWGRFWGWDPKENGALLIVIMNALILHARWGGMVRERGLATLALVGNMVTAWSWFGTNQLGVGLHAYGFNNSLALGCRWFWASQVALLGLGLLPLRCWRLHAEQTAAA
jgi:ABC-type transport system involved in cytochrome c biogenesis permease subunit